MAQQQHKSNYDARYDAPNYCIPLEKRNNKGK
jgi:hypothetical protein